MLKHTLRIMRIMRSLALAVTVIGVIGIVPKTAKADTVYTYNGNGLISGGPGAGISATLDFSAPLGANVDGSVTPLTWYISGFATSLSSSSGTGNLTASFVTDDLGQIVNWGVQATGPQQGSGLEILETIDVPGQVTDAIFSSSISGGNAANANDPGVWTETCTDPPVAVTPEPSSIFLLGSGILGLGGIVRRKICR